MCTTFEFGTFDRVQSSLKRLTGFKSRSCDGDEARLSRKHTSQITSFMDTVNLWLYRGTSLIQKRPPP